ncbi:hypothetical protein CHS0354_028265 [Potamilus streckersoni]|uniref:Uncharacterized protein n=1 Tax=Potamilus streckersoni TaxID=2493646 RepID=A0AAE0RTR4_9BIVA|nr:hypothetical protein CHS0354_028265 [Potamilus streckersoni]
MTTDELVAILAGSLVGLIVFLAILAIIIYFLMGRRKKKKEQAARKHMTKHFPLPHHQLQPNQDPAQSKQSSLSRVNPGYADPRYDYRLPKVGSNPLWFGTPSVYGVRPPQQGYGMRHGGSTSTGYGYPVYQGSHKIYHSEQVGYPPVYEPAYGLTRSGSYLDVYPYAYGYDGKGESYNSRATLLARPENVEYIDPYLEREHRRTGKQVRRSQSDATMHSTRRPKNKRHRHQSPNIPSQGGKSQVNAEIHMRRPDKTKTAAPSLPPLSHTKKPAEETIKALDIIDPDLSPSATDSAKLRAIEKAKEREYLGYNGGENSMNDLNVRPYNYSGSIPLNSCPVPVVPKTEPNSRQRSVTSDPIDFPPSVVNAFGDEVSKSLSDTQKSKAIDMIDGDPPQSPTNYTVSRTVSSGSATVGDNNDIAKEAKKITMDAFGFLEEYSDDDGMDFDGSGQTSPVFSR